MKNKKVTYLLGFLVLIVWGIVLYRLFDTLKGDDELAAQPINNSASKESYNDYAIPKDTTHLLLNYKDPFAIKKNKDTAELAVKKVALVKTVELPVRSANWSFIRYSGFIRNPGTKNLIAVVNINGKSLMMAEGETEEQVKLVKNLQDSIQVSFKGTTAYIKIRSSAL